MRLRTKRATLALSPSRPPSLRPSVRTPAALVTRVKGHAAYSAADGNDLGIEGPAITGFAPGQTVNLRVKAANPAGSTYSAVKTVTTL